MKITYRIGGMMNDGTEMLPEIQREWIDECLSDDEIREYLAEQNGISDVNFFEIIERG